MTIEWNIILWCCITMAVVFASLMLGYYILTARMMKKRRQQVLNIYEHLTVGKRVMFAGMLGKIVKIEGDLLNIEIAKDTIVTVSRYAVTELL